MPVTEPTHTKADAQLHGDHGLCDGVIPSAQLAADERAGTVAVVPEWLSASRMLAPLSDAVTAITPEQKGDALVYVRGAVQTVRQRLKEIADALDEVLLAWMEVNGDLVIDDQTRLYPGTKKTVKCRDVGACLAAIEEAAGGEVEKVVGCLSAGAWKPGACRQLLGEKYGEHFTETIEPDVLTGKPKKIVAESNQFTRRKQVQIHE